MLSFTRTIKQFVINNRNNRFLSHHHYHYHHHSSPGILRTHVIINVIGEKEHVDKAAEEIKMFSQEKHETVIITNSNEKLRSLIFGVNILQVIINKCYNMTCYEIKELHYFTKMLSNFFWRPHYIYVMPNAVNRLVSCDFVKKCEEINFVYPLASTPETKKAVVDILLN
jgi:hypothetical protein